MQNIRIILLLTSDKNQKYINRTKKEKKRLETEKNKQLLKQDILDGK